MIHQGTSSSDAGRQSSRITVRFDDLIHNTSLVFPEPSDVYTAATTSEVEDVFHEIDEARAHGRWIAGSVAYEAAPGLDPTLPARCPEDVMGPAPLAWFAAFDEAPVASQALDGIITQSYVCSPWTLDISEEDYARSIAEIKDNIARGETYQCNFTDRYRARIRGSFPSFYHDLARRQHSQYNAYIETEHFVVASASPELFFELSGQRLRCRPMKGTAPRSEDSQTDELRRLALLGSAKDRAENIMIVDLIRNDASRVAETGTVTVSELLACEQYPTVWQLTSTVDAQLPQGTQLAEVFRALFPCGSITGAPKKRTMELIRSIESTPRGVYCGAIGWAAPLSEDGPARFSVGIRTVEIDKLTADAVYGSGGGITWDSIPADEYKELQAKATVLGATAIAGAAPFAASERRDGAGAP